MKTQQWVRVIFTVMCIFAESSLGDQKFGVGADKAKAVAMSEIMRTPDLYVNKEITVAGTIVDVCAKRGCWMKLTTDYKGEKLRIKVNDGEMVFPLESRGKKAVAKGTFKKHVLTLEQTKAYLQDLAEDNGQKFDPSAVKEAMIIYQVNAVGVIIE